MVYISIQTTTTTTMTTTTVPKSFKTHSPNWTTTTRTQQMHIRGMTYIFNNSINDTPTFETKFNNINQTYTNTPTTILLSPTKFNRPSNQTQKLTSDTWLLASATTSARYGELKERATHLRRARGKLGASRTRSSRPF